jgi:hypothetical protein
VDGEETAPGSDKEGSSLPRVYGPVLEAVAGGWEAKRKSGGEEGKGGSVGAERWTNQGRFIDGEFGRVLECWKPSGLFNCG